MTVFLTELGQQEVAEKTIHLYRADLVQFARWFAPRCAVLGCILVYENAL